MAARSVVGALWMPLSLEAPMRSVSPKVVVFSSLVSPQRVIGVGVRAIGVALVGSSGEETARTTNRRESRSHEEP